MIGIYKITSPSGRIYVGQTTNMKRRIYSYSKSHCSKQILLFNSIKKYGWENHMFEVLEECEISFLNNRERYWQDFYDVLSNKGLNCYLVKTTDRSGKASKETIARMVVKKTGMKASDSTKKKKSILMMGNKYALGHKHDLHTRLKISNSHKGRKCPEYVKLKMSKLKKGVKRDSICKTILNTETGIFYLGVQEVADLIGMNKNTLGQRLNGRAKKNGTSFIYV